MKTITTLGRQRINEMAARYKIRPETIELLLKAIIQGNCTMAQFNIPELGGQGQWMKGGMTMVGDMFNNSLRTTVDKLCNELADLSATRLLFEDVGEIEGQSEGSGMRGSVSTSWPTIFGVPTSTGSQNNFRYAYFGPVHRLVIEEGGRRTIFDTKHHQITGISQQQGAANAYRFTSLEGAVDLNTLERVSDPDGPHQSTPEIAYDVTATADLRSGDKSPDDIILATIAKLNVLLERGQITEKEFEEKKKELLGRL